MNLPLIRSWISGTPEPSEGSASIRPIDPNSGRAAQGVQLPTAQASSGQQLERALESASRAHSDGRWSNLGIEEKSDVLNRFAEELDARSDRIAELDALDSGVPISVTTLFSAGNGPTVRDAIAKAKSAQSPTSLSGEGPEVRLHRVPWGPTALITPWNAPSPMVVKKMSYALAAGAPVVIKPAPAAPHSAELIAEAAAEAGFPNGSWSLVRGGGQIGRSIAEDPRIAAISMTGSAATGKDIAIRAAGRFARLQLELGANNPAIVRADADIEETAARIIDGAWKLSGQWCEAPRRIYAHRQIHADLLDALAAYSARWRIGRSLDAETQLGPVAFPDRRAELLDQRAQLMTSGARLVAESEVPSTGCFMPPSILDCNGAEPADEVFGPILMVNAVATDEEALSAASVRQAGLAGYIFTEDIQAGHRLGKRMPAGEVKINGTSVLDMSPQSEQAFFGSAGIGGHGDGRLLEFFTGARVVGEDRPDLEL